MYFNRIRRKSREKNRRAGSGGFCLGTDHLFANHLFDSPIHPGGLLGGAGEAGGVIGKNGVYKILDRGVVQVGVGR
jgi:hypothetical protein